MRPVRDPQPGTRNPERPRRFPWLLAVAACAAAAFLLACAAPGGGGREVLSLDARRQIEACFQEADQALREGDLDSAEAAYTKALGIHADLAEAYFERGKLRLHRLKQDADVRHGEAAVKDFTAALRIVPTYAKALYNRAVAFYQMADRWPSLYKDAARDLQRLLEVSPRDADAHYFLARILDERMEGMEAQAAGHYQKHLELGGRKPDTQQRLLALAARLPAPAPEAAPAPPAAPR